MGRISTLIATVMMSFSASAEAKIECRARAASAAQAWIFRAKGLASTYTTCDGTPCLRIAHGRVLELARENEITDTVERTYWADKKGTLVVDVEKPDCRVLYVDALQGDL